MFKSIGPEKFLIKTFRRGEIISDMVEGKPSLGQVLSGQVDVYSLALDGSEVKLSTHQPGDIFGVSNLFLPSALETELRCARKAEIRFLPKEDYLALLRESPEAMEQYAVLCNQKIQFLLRRLESLAIQSAQNRILEYLLLHASHGQVVLPSSKEQLAKTLGVGRATLFRELAKLQDEGLIELKGHIIRLENEVALKERLTKA